MKSLKLYIELEALRFVNKFDFNLEYIDGIEPNRIKIPSMLLQPFVENAIWHGLMTKAGKGKLSITLEAFPEKGILKSIIEDNGIGRKASANLKSSNQREHQSMGIDVTRERLENMKLKYNMDVSMKIIDLVDDTGHAKGTRVELIFPLIVADNEE